MLDIVGPPCLSTDVRHRNYECSRSPRNWADTTGQKRPMASFPLPCDDRSRRRSFRLPKYYSATENLPAAREGHRNRMFSSLAFHLQPVPAFSVSYLVRTGNLLRLAFGLFVVVVARCEFDFRCIERTMTPNKITGANAGGPSRLPSRTRRAARIAQFCR
jgi:hypothetical protein